MKPSESTRLTKAEIDFWLSLQSSESEALLRQLSLTDQKLVVNSILQADRKQIKLDERAAQAKRMAEKRAAVRNLEIPVPENPNRRQACLSDPVEFLTTYFASTFYQPFTPDRIAMITSIVDAARYGGDFAIAGPRGEGKTRLAIYGALYLMFAGLSEFPVVIGKSQTKAQNELKTIKERLQQNELLIADFPEIGVPFKAVGGWSSRARMQTVANQTTNIEIASDHIIFPKITRNMLSYDWPDWCEPVSSGQTISSLGIDGPIRGTNYRDMRPTLAILDDIESKESATSDAVIYSNEQIIEKDIGGLGGSGRRVSRVMLCTTQNRKCIAYKYTDREQKPSWNGQRFRKMIAKPARMDLWEQYIEKRINKTEDDPDAREAYRFYRDNQTVMDSECEIGNPYSFDDRKHSDGEPLEISAIQAYFNRVADFGEESVATEDDNDPPVESGPEASGISAPLVSSRISGLDKSVCPANTVAITAGIDIGKYVCHWSVIAWTNNATGVVIDYGVAEVVGTDVDSDDIAIEKAIYRTLLQFRDWLVNAEFKDTTGAVRQINRCFCDSGDYTQSVYEFVRQVGHSVFVPTKGVGKYKEPQPSAKTKVGRHLHASYLAADNVWLHLLDVDYWKRFVHERFLTPTFDENNLLRAGSLSIYFPEGSKNHLSFAQHIVAEEWVTEFQKGKGEKCFWMVHNRNNHWLDAVAMASAAASLHGVSPLAGIKAPKLAPQAVQQAKQRSRRKPQIGSRQKANWINRVRRSR